MKVMAVKVFPEPVAIWINARGLFSLKDTSRLFMALIWHSRRPSVGREGRSRSPFLSVFSPFNNSLKVSGLWKVNTGRERGFGSRKLVKWVIVPVLSYTKDNGSLLRCFSLLAAYPPDCSS